jgi:hypothetical protein
MKQKGCIYLLAALILLFLLQRGALILFGYSHISHPGIDEPVSGVLACDILDGQIRAPLFTYEYLNRSGDVLIEGLLLVPYFALFGRSICSTKVFALTSALITFLCWFMFIRKYQGVVAAVLFGLLFALPPPLFARQSLIGTISSHHMLNPLIAVQSLLLFKILETRHNNSLPVWTIVACGFFAGLGIYIFYTYLLFLGFCGIILLLFFPQILYIRTIVLIGCGFIIGFLPWLLRAVSTPAGGQYLGSILKNIGIDWWSFVQNFGFVLPHSFGYGYPSRAISLLSIGFVVFFLFSIAIIVDHCLRPVVSRSRAGEKGHSNLSISSLQGLFCALFPIFFFIGLSLSPMRIMPFEYWPSIGLFATFGPSDVIRYRWLHILFPFYFAAIAIGVSVVLTSSHTNRVKQVLIIFLLVFFIGCNIWKSFALYSADDSGTIFLYKGYNYDQFAPKFLLGDFAPRDILKAFSITENYPEENRGEAFKSFGTLLAGKVIRGVMSMDQMDAMFQKVPPQYRKDCVYGMVRLAQSSEQQFQALHKYLAGNYPALFYENWGSCNLGYKYYGALVNQQILLNALPASERWFYRNFLNKFKQEISDIHTGSPALLKEINATPSMYQADVVRGLGKLIGSEMLFDTMNTPDYPLDSNFGENFLTPLKEAFYQGIGSGFASTLCRFWRMQQLPENPDVPRYARTLDLEWNRCIALMVRLPQQNMPAIKRGFRDELLERQLPAGIKRYVVFKLPFIELLDSI